MRERAWWLLVVLVAMLALFGVSDVLIGATADPGIALAIAGIGPEELRSATAEGFRLYDFTTRGLGLALLVIGLLLLTILVIPYRGGQQWASRVMWLLPAWSIAVPILYVAYGVQSGQPLAPPMVSGPILAILSVAVLLLDRRRFERSAVA
jgi:hypothetical protein